MVSIVCFPVGAERTANESWQPEVVPAPLVMPVHPLKTVSHRPLKANNASKVNGPLGLADSHLSRLNLLLFKL